LGSFGTPAATLDSGNDTEVLSPEPKDSLKGSNFFRPVGESEKSNVDRYMQVDLLEAFDD